MYNEPPFLIHLLHFCEFIALFFYFKNFKNQAKTSWKWFGLYLTYIFFIEIFDAYFNYSTNVHLEFFMSYLTIPIEFLFFIWLFAMISLKNKQLYIISTIFYLLSFIPDLSLEKGSYYFNSFNYLIGGFILLFLVLLELNNQIKSDDILLFKENKMFYITIGVALFYIGNLPFFGLYYLILKSPNIWNLYYVFFMLSNCLMYLLFAVSFIWGKPKS